MWKFENNSVSRSSPFISIWVLNSGHYAFSSRCLYSRSHLTGSALLSFTKQIIYHQQFASGGLGVTLGIESKAS